MSPAPQHYSPHFVRAFWPARRAFTMQHDRAWIARFDVPKIA